MNFSVQIKGAFLRNTFVITIMTVVTDQMKIVHVLTASSHVEPQLNVFIRDMYATITPTVYVEKMS